MLDLFLEACRRDMNMLLRLNTVNQAGGGNRGHSAGPRRRRRQRSLCWHAGLHLSSFMRPPPVLQPACFLSVCLSAEVE